MVESYETIMSMKPDLKLVFAEHGYRPADVARKCDVDKSTVTHWINRGVPLVRVFQIEKETGIPRWKLRPEFFAETVQ